MPDVMLSLLAAAPRRHDGEGRSERVSLANRVTPILFFLLQAGPLPVVALAKTCMGGCRSDGEGRSVGVGVRAPIKESSRSAAQGPGLLCVSPTTPPVLGASCGSAPRGHEWPRTFHRTDAREESPPAACFGVPSPSSPPSSLSPPPAKAAAALLFAPSRDHVLGRRPTPPHRLLSPPQQQPGVHNFQDKGKGDPGRRVVFLLCGLPCRKRAGNE